MQTDKYQGYDDSEEIARLNRNAMESEATIATLRVEYHKLMQVAEKLYWSSVLGRNYIRSVHPSGSNNEYCAKMEQPWSAFKALEEAYKARINSTPTNQEIKPA